MGKHQALYCIICFAAGVIVTVGGLYVAGLIEFNSQAAPSPGKSASRIVSPAPAPRSGGAGTGGGAPTATPPSASSFPVSYDAWQTDRLSADAAARTAAAQQLRSLFASDRDEDKLTGWTYVSSFWSKPAAGGRVATADEFWALMREINFAERVEEGAKSANVEIKKQADAARATFVPWKL